MSQTGENHERAGQFYGESGRCASIPRDNGFDLCAGRSSIAAIEAGAGLGSDQGGDDQTLARRWQEPRWWAWIAVACGLVCAIAGLDVGRDFALAADGEASQRECGGAAVSGFDRARGDAHP